LFRLLPSTRGSSLPSRAAVAFADSASRQAAMPGSVGELSSYACAAVAGSSSWSRLVTRMFWCSDRPVSVLQPPYVFLLSPRLSAGPAAGSSALSCSVAQHLLFCASPRLGRLYGKVCWIRRPALPPLLRGLITPPALVSWPGAPSPGVAVPAFGSGMACLWGAAAAAAARP
jgi:hypothetical protein